MREELKFNNNWIYKAVDRIGFLFKPGDGANSNSSRRGTRSFLISFVKVIAMVIVVYHLIPLSLAMVDGVAWGGPPQFRPFWRDLSQYGFSFVTVVLLLSGRRFSEIQNDLIRGWQEKKITQLEINELVRIFNDGKNEGEDKGGRKLWMRLLRLFLVASAFILPILLYIHLLKDGNVFSWHGVQPAVLPAQGHLYGLKAPTLCGLYVCMFVWTSGVYLIVSGVFEGIMWIWFIYGVTRTPLRIDPNHPDHCGGLHSFRYSVFAWSALIIAVGVLVALDTMNYLAMAPTKELKREVFVRWDVFLKRIVYIAGGFSIFLFPMVPIAFQLFDRKVKAEKEADALARLYLKYFRRQLEKVLKDAGGYTKAIGDADANKHIENLENISHLNTYYTNLVEMKIWPLDFAGALKIVAAVLGPLSIILIPEAREYLKDLIS